MSDERHEPVADAELAAEAADLDAMLGRRGITLSDPAVWEAAPASVEDQIIDAIDVETGIRRPTRRRGLWLGVAAAAVAAAAAVTIVAGIALTSRPSADWEVALIPTDAAPEAAAVVYGWNEPAGTRLALDIDGLGDAPEGFIYELWFSREDRHISAGTFRGTDDLQMWVGIRRGEFPRVWITLEPLDNDPGPGRTVLDVEA